MAVELIKGNAIIGQSGGPTAVINQSLVGVIQEIRATLVRKGVVKKILGMRHGVSGLVKDQIVDLTKVKDSVLAGVARSPAAALGSSRDKPDRGYCQAILDACARHKVRYFFYIGGNDSSDTCRIVNDLADEAGFDMKCFHVPKTIDNDLVGSDHTPGYPSAARFNALAFMSDNLDNASLPGIKINVVMGRHAGFLTAATALARRGDDDGPHLIYVPEVPFDEERFVQQVEAVYARLGRCQIAVSEGIQDAQGRPIAAKLLQQAEHDAHGNMALSGTGILGDTLADLCRKRIKGGGGKAVRVRSDTFGYLQRCWPDPSPVDVREARAVAKFAVRMAARGVDNGSVAIVRERGKKYKVGYKRIELSAVAAKTRHLPPEFIEGTADISDAFVKYARPLVGELPELRRL